MEPDKVPAIPFAIQAVLVLAGLGLLWRLQFSPQARKNAAETPLTHWNASLLDLGMLIWVVILGGFACQVGATAVIKQFSLSTTAGTILASAAFQGGMLTACLGFARYSDAGKNYSLPRGGFLKGGFATFLCALPLIYGTGALWHWILTLFGVKIDEQDLVDMFRNTKSGLLLGSMISLAVLMAPLTEELIFRAGIFRFLRTRTPRWVALLVPAVLFGALHMNLASFPQLVLLGVIFAVSYERTGNIAVPMFAHALFNLNTILMILAGINA